MALARMADYKLGLSAWWLANWKWAAGILVSVLVTWLAYPPGQAGLLMLFGLAPVFIAAELAPDWKSAFLRGWAYAFLSNIFVCSWVAYAVHHFGKVPLVLSYGLIPVHSLAEQGSWAVLLGLRHMLHSKFGIRPIFWTPAAFVALECVWPRYFPSTPGNVFYNVPLLAQVADVTGVWGLSALVVATNEATAALVLQNWSRRQRIIHSVAATALVIGCVGYGSWRLGVVRQWMSAPKTQLRVALIQPNINPVARVRGAIDFSGARFVLLSEMLKLNQKALPQKPELIFWPESAYPDTYHGASRTEAFEVTATLDSYLRKNLKLPLLFGARFESAEHRRYNALFYAHADANAPDGLSVQRYLKYNLLPFAEHIPFTDSSDRLRKLIRKAGGTAFSPGPGPTLLNGPRGLQLGSMICLDGLYPRFARDTAALGADVFVNATNDSWFGPTREPELHLYLTAFRSIETRRPLVRATNTGHSAVVDIDGSLGLKTELEREAIEVVDVPVYEQRATPFMLIGDKLLILSGLYATLMFLFGLIRRRGNHEEGVSVSIPAGPGA